MAKTYKTSVLSVYDENGNKIPVPAIKGADGKDGNPGKDGKSAYAYAQDGGYTGTEAEFAEKLAAELVTKKQFDSLSDTIDELKNAGIIVVQDGTTLSIRETEV